MGCNNSRSLPLVVVSIIVLLGASCCTLVVDRYQQTRKLERRQREVKALLAKIDKEKDALGRLSKEYWNLRYEKLDELRGNLRALDERRKRDANSLTIYSTMKDVLVVLEDGKEWEKTAGEVLGIYMQLDEGHLTALETAANLVEDQRKLISITLQRP